MSKITKIKKQFLFELSKCEVYDLCKEYDIDLREIMPYQFRLSKGKTTIDIYPKGRKYFLIYKDNVKIEKWGAYNKTKEILSIF